MSDNILKIGFNLIHHTIKSDSLEDSLMIYDNCRARSVISLRLPSRIIPCQVDFNNHHFLLHRRIYKILYGSEEYKKIKKCFR